MSPLTPCPHGYLHVATCPRCRAASGPSTAKARQTPPDAQADRQADHDGSQRSARSHAARAIWQAEELAMLVRQFRHNFTRGGGMLGETELEHLRGVKVCIDAVVELNDERREIWEPPSE